MPALAKPVTSDQKLPNPSASRRHTSRRTTNEWLAADQRDKVKTMGTVALVAVILATGLWLIIGAVVH